MRAPRHLACLLATALVGSAVAAPTPDRLPPLELQGVSGDDGRLAPGAERLHVVFFATWCPPCVEELEALRRIESDYRGRGYELVLVAVRTRQTFERLSKFVLDQDPPGRMLFDKAGTAGKRLGVESLPAHRLFDREGRLLYESDELTAKLEALLAEGLEPAEGKGGR